MGTRESPIVRWKPPVAAPALHKPAGFCGVEKAVWLAAGGATLGLGVSVPIEKSIQLVDILSLLG